MGLAAGYLSNACTGIHLYIYAQVVMLLQVALVPQPAGVSMLMLASRAHRKSSDRRRGKTCFYTYINSQKEKKLVTLTA